MSSLYFEVAQRTTAKFNHCCVLARSHSHFIYSIVYPPPYHVAIARTQNDRQAPTRDQSAAHQN